MKRRNALAAIALPLFQGCSYQRYFTLAWREEVQLFDGSITWVSFKYIYERLSEIEIPSFYTPSLPRSTEVSFDAGEPFGKFVATFAKHTVVEIQRLSGTWYFMIQTCGAPNSFPTEDGWKEEWGEMEDMFGHKYLKLESSGLVFATAEEFPNKYLFPNVLQDYADARYLKEQFDGRNVTLARKREYVKDFPLNPDDYRIKRRGS